MGIVLRAFCPHPPLLVPQVGGMELELVRKTKGAMETVARNVKEAEPEVVIIISPHAPLFRDAFSLWELPQMEGDFGQFGAPHLQLKRELDLGLAARVASREKNLVRLNQGQANSYGLSTKLDHGCLVPLYYLHKAGVDVPILPLGMSLLPFPKLYNFGLSLREAIEELGRRAAIIASGDLSHCLTADAPGGYHPQGELFDREFVDKLVKMDVAGLSALNSDLVEAAGQCGFNSLAILLGTLEGLEARASVLSYEGPFGVGYCTAQIAAGEEDPTRFLAQSLEANWQRMQANKKTEVHKIVRLAMDAVEAFVESGKVISPEEAPEELLKTRAGAFVTLKQGGQLRGCIGTIGPTKATLAQEIIANAIAAATEDPRFSQVEPEELTQLTYSVDVLGEPEAIDSLSQLDPERFGVIVKSGRRRGLLLPNLEGVDSAQRQVAIAKSKAGIGPEEDVELFRFQVVRYR